MKKVLYISYDGMTDPLGQSQVIPYLRQLTKAGYHFHILSVEKKKRLEEKKSLIHDMLRSAGIEWSTLLFTSRPPFVSKLYDQWKLNREVKKICQREKIDLLHCRSYVAAAAGLKAGKKTGIPFLFDMRGFWVDERVDSGLWNLRNPFFRILYKIYKRKEKKYLSAATHIISLTDKGREELVKNYNVPGDKITVIPCCADMEHFNFSRISTEQKNILKQQLNIAAGAKVLSYLGSLGGWYMTGEMLDFFLVFQQRFPGAVFLFITHDKKEDIIAMAGQKGIRAEQVRVQAAGRDEVPGYISISDWNIFFIRDAYSKKASSPTKQGEVMAMGVPVICNDIGDSGMIVEKAHSGLVVHSFTSSEYSNVVAEMARFSNSPEKIREKALRYYDLQSGVQLYNNVYQLFFS